ncbi:MAG: glycerophosphodiester phosphodiesterase [Spirochaetota bacterium]
MKATAIALTRTKKILTAVAVGCLLVLISMESAMATPLPWTAQEKFLFGGVSMGSNIEPYFDIYTGDHPLIIQASPGEFSIHTGMPLYLPFPFIISGGTVNQFGFFDAYSKRTLFQSGSVGFVYDMFGDRSIDRFISWGMRFDEFSAGIGLYERTKRAVGQINYTSKYVELFSNAEYSFEHNQLTDWQVGADIRTGDFYSLRVALNDDLSVTAAVGLSHRDIPADYMDEYEWDFLGGHRGAIVSYPENSREAFEYALSREELSFVETDLNITKDDKYAAVHDPLLLRYTGEADLLNSLTLDEIQNRDLGSFFSQNFSHVRALSLEDVAAMFDGSENTGLLIELKAVGTSEEDAKRVFAAVDEAFEHDNYAYFIMFHGQYEMMEHVPEEIEWGYSYMNPSYLPPGIMLHSLIYPLLEYELDVMRKEYDPDFFIMFIDSLAFYDQLVAYAREHTIDFFFWDFKDTLHGISGSKSDTPSFAQ